MKTTLDYTRLLASNFATGGIWHNSGSDVPQWHCAADMARHWLPSGAAWGVRTCGPCSWRQACRACRPLAWSWMPPPWDWHWWRTACAAAAASSVCSCREVDGTFSDKPKPKVNRNNILLKFYYHLFVCYYCKIMLHRINYNYKIRLNHATFS